MRPETVLAFDTSAAHCAAALLLPDGRCLTLAEDMARGQAERLLPMLSELLAEAGAAWRDLTRIGVGIGPGNFTGIRISVAAARGLALGLGVPAIGVGRFEALAHRLPRPLLVVEPGRTGEVWVQRFDIGSEGPLLACDPAEVPRLATDAAATGSAAHLTDGPVLAPALPLAEAVARLAALRAPGARPAPLYLRPADAAPPSDPPPVILP
ncbi:MAG: tRNA (adenosine(37)-N6)-threonylcarbamoyltransferase complex dimerization subunit type 1 TsaB [Gemmobacter sp.]|uniref:tRNA (adenosine(37)-N6)-threonylcarbamoyltransferase complex dimerization subunit type 1 TsaB n=1 Tax=Gemmobacter sp. TaxID=1898957 RepID=UPI00391DF6AD